MRGFALSEKMNGLKLGMSPATIEYAKPHVPSEIQADTLFTFMRQLDFLLPIIRTAMISPRYCEEDISYLGIEGFKRMAYPMKCFCDINMHRLETHLSWYGYYGIAFSKEWGMRNKIQPVQYINPESELCRDFSRTFSTALKIDSQRQSPSEQQMKSCLLHQLMYYKPYSGPFKNRVTGETEEKCFTDECEWRYIPELDGTDFPPVYYDEQIFNAGVMEYVSNSMVKVPEIALKFKYSDVKYIIVKTKEDFSNLISAIEELPLDKLEKYELISKVLTWDTAKGDF